MLFRSIFREQMQGSCFVKDPYCAAHVASTRNNRSSAQRAASSVSGLTVENRSPNDSWNALQYEGLFLSEKPFHT